MKKEHMTMLSLFLIPLMLFSACGAPSAPPPVETESSAQVQPAEQVRPVEGVPGPAELLYQGQASMRIVTDEGKVIYIDPYVGEGYDLPADLILVTHTHYDHNGVDRIENRNPDCQIITWKEAIQNGEHPLYGLPLLLRWLSYGNQHSRLSVGLQQLQDGRPLGAESDGRRGQRGKTC